MSAELLIAIVWPLFTLATVVTYGGFRRLTDRDGRPPAWIKTLARMFVAPEPSPEEKSLPAAFKELEARYLRQVAVLGGSLVVGAASFLGSLAIGPVGGAPAGVVAWSWFLALLFFGSVLVAVYSLYALTFFTRRMREELGRDSSKDDPTKGS